MNESRPPGFSELFDSDVNDTKIGIISTQKKIGIFEVTEKNILHLLAWSFGIFLFFYRKSNYRKRNKFIFVPLGSINPSCFGTFEFLETVRTLLDCTLFIQIISRFNFSKYVTFFMYYA